LAPEVAELLDLLIGLEHLGGVAVVTSFGPGVAGPAPGGVLDVSERHGLQPGSDLVASFGGEPEVGGEADRAAGVEVVVPDRLLVGAILGRVWSNLFDDGVTTY
jgi:hypothetical protein